jgi:hypothetical protein
MIFSDIEQLKEQIGGGVNSSVDISSLTPAYQEAVQKNIVPLLGDNLWNTIDTTWDGAPTPETTALLPYVRSALAHLTMYEYSHFGNVQFAEAGLVRMESDQMKTAYKYQEQQYKKWMRDAGYNRLEEIQLFLMNNSANYPSWDANEAYQYLINTARTFRAYYGKTVNRYTFEMLQGLMQEIELIVIESNVGANFYERLRSGQQAGDLTDAELTALHKAYRAITHYTIEEAMLRHFVTFDGDQIVKYEGAVNQTYTSTRPADSGDAIFSKRYHEHRAKLHLDRLLAYLQSDLDSFPLYKTFYDAQQAELAAAEEDELDVRNGYPNPPTSEDENRGGVIRW